ncbi:helix-turn-helix transcriptional regulator [Rhizobium sp. PP-F2F-G48]|uniref:helix-turn-helix domain-containing protein n=1 Tax=Rhizobium sp. PP-F2F-G48 TaxID=2135651 RepID=UPI001044D1E6|nr:helix-turn-helix transcriptional regulator [Rhizobium sp. PP-F2F-G48]
MPQAKSERDRRFDPVDVHVGARLREQRLALGLSQVMLGVRLGVTFQQIQKYERGANRISAAKLHHAARALDVEMAFFFVGLPGNGDGPTARLTPPNGAEVLPTPEDLSLLRDFHRLSSNSQRAVLDVIKELAGRGAHDGDDG